MKTEPGGVTAVRAGTAAAAFLLAAAGQADAPLARPIAPFERVPRGAPSFFVTSRGLDGGDLGGLAGADAHCARLAGEAGLKATSWRAYLSTQPTAASRGVDARDRIGAGPWFNVEGLRIATDVSDLHGDTLDQARRGNVVAQATALTERGERIAGENEPAMRHDILTGSLTDGRAFRDRHDRTCRNWTYAGDAGSAQIGHSDRDTRGLSISWNSAHQTLGCSPAKLAATGGAGLFYCFATSPASAPDARLGRRAEERPPMAEERR